MFRVAVVAGNAPAVTFPVADDDAVCQRVQAVFLTEHGKQLHCHLIGSLCHFLCRSDIGTGKVRACRVLDTRRLAHLHSDMGIVPAPLVSASAMPSPVVPGKRLINRPIIPVNESMDARGVMRRAVPRIDEHGRFRLRTAHGMKHQPLDRDLPPRHIAGISCQNAFHQFHAYSSPFPLSALSWSCSKISFSFSGMGSPRCPAFSRRLTPSLEI